VNVGVDLSVEELTSATMRCCLRARRGAARPNHSGRELNGVHFAMDFLPQQNGAFPGNR